jgi:membrane fusion protein (multidrug efflux system)
VDVAPEPEPERRSNGHERAARPPLRERTRQSLRAHRRGYTIAAVVSMVALAGGALVWWWLAGRVTTDDAQIDAHISGVATRVAGTVVAVHVEDNQPVAAGQLLVELDARDFQVSLRRAEAELLAARAQLEAEHPQVPITSTTNVTNISTSASDVASSRAAVAAAERDRDSAGARVREAEANVERAVADERRYRYLLEQHAAPRERYDQARAAAKATRAQVASNRALLRAAAKTVDEARARLAQALSRQSEVAANGPRQLDARRAQTDARRAQVDAAQAALEQARLNLTYTRVVAPVAGVVGRRSAEPGNHVAPGEQLVAVVALDDVWVTANFKETQLGKLRVGQRARVHVDALGRDYDGRVESIAGASGARFSLLPPENATGNFVKVVQRIPVRIHLDAGQDSEHRLRPGMSVEPKVFVR